MRIKLGAMVVAVACAALTLDAQGDHPNAQSPRVGGPDLLARARAIHKQVPLIDGHNDYPWALRGLHPGRDFSAADISEPVAKLMTDIPRLRKGGVGGQFWSVYVPSTMQGKDAVRATLEQIDIVHRMTIV